MERRIERIWSLDAPVMARSVQISAEVVLVDGPSRSGKSTVARALASFERLEKEREEVIYDFIGVLREFGKISHDGAIVLVRALADLMIYESYLGRNVNFRLSDNTSALNYPRKLEYIRRLLLAEGDACLDRIRRNRPILQVGVHHQLPHIDLYFAALNDRLHVIEMRRHPVDLVADWESRGYSTNIGRSPRGFSPCIEYNGRDVYYLAVGREEEYINGSSVDRTIIAIYTLMSASAEAFRALGSQERERVMVLRYEEFVANPRTWCERLAAFLGTRTTRYTWGALRRAGFPRPNPVVGREERLRAIRAKANPATLAVLEKMVEEYEKEWH